MNAKLSPTRTAALVAGVMLALLSSTRAAETDALPSFDTNYLKVSGTVPWSSGSSAAFQRRAQYSHDGAGGIEAFNYSEDLSKTTTYQLDGRALPGAGDYLAQFKLTKNEVGSFEAGYKRFRTFYDGAGGFFPTNNAWRPIYPRSRYVDRAKFFVNATLELPKVPVFSFHYTNELRNGTKDSTIWGDSDFTGIPIYSLSSLNPVTATRKILPAYIQLGERQQTWELSAKQTVGNTTGTFSIIGTRINNLDSRSVDRYTGELKPYPAIPSNPVTLVSPALANNPNKGFQVDGFKENAINYVGKLETKLSDAITAYAEASYRHSTGNTNQSRLISASLATGTGVQTLVGAYAPGGRPPYSFTDAGTLKTDIYTGVVGLRTTPLKSLSVDFALRGEQRKISADSSINYVSNMVVLATGAVTPVSVPGPNSLRNNEKPWTPEVEVNYDGIPNLALYGTWDYRRVRQDQRINYTAFTVNTTTGALTGPLTPELNNIKERYANIKLGANWTPNKIFSLRPEFFTKNHENRFDGYGVSDDTFYVLNYDIYGARVSAILRPLSGLTFNTRYIVQRGKAQVEDDASVKGTSGDSRRVQIGETIDWVPNKSLYLQGSVSVVYDTIITSYPRVTGLAQAVVHNADNNYWNGSALVGFVLDKQTDAQIQGTYYKANNYNAALAAATLPFGAAGKESTVTCGVKHKFSDRLVGDAKLGYFDRKDDTSGGNANFRGPLAYLSLSYRL